MSISKEDFALWQNHPITLAFMEACEERVEEAKEVLAGNAGLDSITDNFYRGFIYAFREIQEFKVED